MVLFVLFCFSSGVETVARLFKPITGRGNAKPSKAIIFHRVPQIKTRHVAKFCRWTSKDFFKTISPQFSKPEFYVRISSQWPRDWAALYPSMAIISRLNQKNKARQLTRQCCSSAFHSACLDTLFLRS